MLDIVQVEGHIDEVEDELFRFAGIVEGNDDLRMTLELGFLLLDQRSAWWSKSSPRGGRCPPRARPPRSSWRPAWGTTFPGSSTGLLRVARRGYVSKWSRECAVPLLSTRASVVYCRGIEQLDAQARRGEGRGG